MGFFLEHLRAFDWMPFWLPPVTWVLVVITSGLKDSLSIYLWESIVFFICMSVKSIVAIVCQRESAKRSRNCWSTSMIGWARFRVKRKNWNSTRNWTKWEGMMQELALVCPLGISDRQMSDPAMFTYLVFTVVSPTFSLLSRAGHTSCPLWSLMAASVVLFRREFSIV